MATIPSFPDKDPSARLDYAFDFTNLLETAEQITVRTVTFEPNDGSIVNESDVIEAGGKRIILIASGGIAGTTYHIIVNVTTDTGGPPTRIFERACSLTVKNR